MATRTICIPVAEVIEGGSKQEFYTALRKVLDLCVTLANTAVNYSVKQDDFSQKKAPKIYTYPSVKSLAPGASYLTSTICRNAEKSYKADRWHVIRGKKTVRNHRSVPLPLLHHKGNQTFTLTDQGEWIEARIKIGEVWFTVRLAGGSAYKRQTGMLKKVIASGDYGDSKMWIDHKNKAIIGVTCKVLPKEVCDLSGSMLVSSSAQHLLCMTKDGSSVPYVINADELKRWVAEKNVKYQRLRQDRKSGIDRRRIRREMNRVSAKYRKRLHSVVHATAAAVVKKAQRLKVATIVLDTTIRSYVESFPWYDLESKIRYKAEDAGVTVETQTVAIELPEDERINQPHIYFKLSPTLGRVKIGKTARSDGGRHKTQTDSAEQLILLAVENVAKTDLTRREKHYHALFQQCAVIGEWFVAEPVIAWLREVGWYGNTGNLSQIMQYLDASRDASGDGVLNANRECPSVSNPIGCSQNADNKQGYAGSNQPALAVGETSFNH